MTNARISRLHQVTGIESETVSDEERRYESLLFLSAALVSDGTSREEVTGRPRAPRARTAARTGWPGFPRFWSGASPFWRGRAAIDRPRRRVPRSDARGRGAALRRDAVVARPLPFTEPLELPAP